MAEVAEQGDQANAAGDQQAAGPGWMTTISRWIMMYYVINFFMGKFRPDPSQTAPKTDVDGNPIVSPISQHPHSPLWKPNVKYDLRIYLSEEPDLFSIIYAPSADDSLVYRKSHIQYSCNDESFDEKQMNVTVPTSLQNNGSYYAHIIMSQSGYPYNEHDEDYDHTRVVFRTHPLVQYRKRAAKKNQNLLFNAQDTPDDTTDEPDADDTDTVDQNIPIAHWKPELTLRPLCDWTAYKSGSIPAQIFEHYTIDIDSNQYWPVLYMDDFWLLGDKLIALNTSVSEVPLTISLSPISQWKFMLQNQMQQQYEQQAKWGMSSSEENDEVRRLLMESNPVLLGVTMVVTLFHTLFDFLA
eukprot:285720_1